MHQQNIEIRVGGEACSSIDNLLFTFQPLIVITVVHYLPLRLRLIILTLDLDYSGYHKKLIQELFKIVLFYFTVLPNVPKDFRIEYKNSSAVRVGWSMATSGETVIAYHVELSTSDGNVVTRKSSSKERSLLLTHLLPNIEYRVRVQAENAAGNGSSSSYVSINLRGGISELI